MKASRLGGLVLSGVAWLGAAIAQEGAPHSFLPSVELAALVLDRQGRPVTDLEAAEFRVSLAGLPVQELQQPAGGSQTFVVLVDHQLLPPGRLQGLVDALARFTSARAQRGDRVLLASFDGSLELVAPLARDGSTAQLRLAELSGRRATALAVEVDRQWRRRSPEQPDHAPVALGERASLDDALRRASRASLDGLESLLQAVGDLAGPKALLYVTGGLPYASDPRSTSEAPRSFSVRVVSGTETPLPGSPQDSPSLRYLVSQPPLPSGQGRNVPPRLAALLAAAGQAQVTFFPWIVEPAAAELRGGLAGSLERRTLFEPHLAELARSSGGELLRAGHPQAAMERLETLLGGTYRLRFAAPAAVEGASPMIKVEVSRPRLEVRHASTVALAEAGPSPAAHALGALWRGNGENPLRLTAVAGPAVSRGTGTIAFPLDFALPCDHVRFETTASGEQARLTLAVAVREPGGRASPVERLALRATRPTMEAEPCRLSYVTELVLAADSEAVAVAVADELSGEVAALRLALR